MKRTRIVFLLALSAYIIGCSTPEVATYSQLYSITRKEEKKKVAMGGSKKFIIIKDFRLNEAYDEDIAALKEKVEKYISGHADLSDPVRTSLRELKVCAGLTKEQVELLLGRPDKAAAAGASNKFGAQEEWVYRINKTRIVSFFIVPLVPVKESYHFFFKQDNLAGIERHFLKQVVKEEPGSGLYEITDKVTGK